MIGVRQGARAAGADPDITQNGVAANTFAIANAWTGGTDVVGAGAAGGNGRPTAPVTQPANVRAALAGDVVDPPPPLVVDPPPPPEIIPSAVLDPPPPPEIIPPAGSTSANTVCSTILQGTSSHSRSSTGATAGSSSSRSTVEFNQARVLFFHSKRK